MQPRSLFPALLLLLLLLLSLLLAGPTHANETKDEEGEGGIIISNPLCAGEEVVEGQQLLVLFCVLVACVIATYVLLRFEFHYLPESCATILIGIIIGVAVRLSGEEMTRVVRLDPELFFIFLLPGIIFDAAYNMNRGDFFGNIGSICAFAIFGTVMSNIVIGSGLYVLGYIGASFPLPFLDCYLFGALISAVDPVATLAIFSALGVNATLYMIVFGESVLNDAVAIVLFNTVAVFKDNPIEGHTILLALWQFMVLFFGSSLVGVAGGLVASLFFKYVRVGRYVHMEVGLMLVSSFMIYLVAEASGLSGIMCILAAGIIMSYYTRRNLSKKGERVVSVMVRAGAFISETWVFSYLGLAVFTFRHEFSFSFIVWAVLLCFLGRAVHIFPISAVLNRFRKSDSKIAGKNQFIMWFSGPRGAIAFALAINMLRPEGPSAYAPLIFTTTLVIVLFTVGLQGAMTLPLLKFMKVEMASSVTFSKSARMATSLDAYWAEVVAERSSGAAGCIALLDQRYLQKWFVREHARRIEAFEEVRHDAFAQPWEVSAKDTEIEMKELVERSHTMRRPVGSVSALERAITQGSGVSTVLRAIQRNPAHAELLREALKLYEEIEQRFDGPPSGSGSDSDV